MGAETDALALTATVPDGIRVVPVTDEAASTRSPRCTNAPSATTRPPAAYSSTR